MNTAETHEHVRDAMVRDPLSLGADATAQQAGEALSPADVRAVFVCDDHRLVGVVTRKTLVREVVAKGLDPTATTLRSIAEPPLHTIEADLSVEDAFRILEEHDLERVPVTEGGRLVGVLSRSVLGRRLAYDEDLEPPDA
ncbi:MAG: cyclic nucleotide-binding/CBS domain-containing protein [Pseudomonadota bacterium]